MTKAGRFILTLLAVLTAGLGFTSTAPAEDFRIERSVYRVDISGVYTKTWQGQTSGYPQSHNPWSYETGKTTSTWALPGKGVKFAGSEFFGDLPGTTPLPKFQFGAMRPVVAKAKNRSGFDRKINYWEPCGGELGQCTGNERNGLEASSKSCKADGKIPIDMRYDAEGRKPRIDFEFGQHRSMTDFCGKSHPDDDDSIDDAPKLGWLNGLDEVRTMKVGQTLSQGAKTAYGWIGGDGDPRGARKVKGCPSMSGVGSRYCRTLEFKLLVKRIK